MESKGIYPEFCDGDYICFYLSPATKKRHFQALQRALKKAFALFPLNTENCVERLPAPLVSSLQGEKEWVDLDEAEDRICAGACGLFPPCTPLIRSGEKITKDKLLLLKKANNLFGVYENKILVYKGEEQ